MSRNALSFIDPKWKHQLRVAVPLYLRWQILDKCHHGLSEGHFCRQRTYDNLPRTQRCQGMYAEVQSYVRNFPECFIVSGSGWHQSPSLKPIPVKRLFIPGLIDQNVHALNNEERFTTCANYMYVCMHACMCLFVYMCV